jgi:hypothetical protein
MMGDIDAGRKKASKKKPKQLCMRLSPSKTFHRKICLQNYEEEEEEEKKKRVGQYNATISSPAGLQLDQKLKIKQQLQSAATGSTASKQQRFRNSGNQKTKD